MRLQKLAAIAAASSLLLASAPALSASSLSLASIERAGASADGESDFMDSGLQGFLIVFGAGAAIGALLYSVIKGSNDEPVSP